MVMDAQTRAGGSTKNVSQRSSDIVEPKLFFYFVDRTNLFLFTQLNVSQLNLCFCPLTTKHCEFCLLFYCRVTIFIFHHPRITLNSFHLNYVVLLFVRFEFF